MTKARDLANAGTALSAVSATELGFVDGVTSAIQTQIDTKLATATAATTYVANSLADAKGDLFVASADNTVTRLPVGNSGEQIVADSSTTTGLRWNTPISLANPVINGGQDIWQRGTSVSLNASSGYAGSWGSDRWFMITAANQACTISRQSVSDSTNLPNIQYCARVQRNSGQTGTSGMDFTTNFETTNSIPFAGKAITVTFYARAGANYSPTSSILISRLYTGTGTDQNIQTTGFTGQTTAVSQNNTLTTTWQRFVYTYTVPSTVTQFAMTFGWTPTGTASTNDYFEITGIQMDLGTYTATTAPTFRRTGGTIQGELAACQRYYYQATGGYYFCTGSGATSSNVVFGFPLPTVMRTTPSYSVSAFGDFYLQPGDKTFTSINANTGTTGATAIGSFYTSGATGLTAGYSYTLYSQTGSIKFSSEL
jgi:hypothetical protein